MNKVPIPILSPNPSPMEQEAASPTERKQKEADTQSAYEIYREIIKDNTGYDILMQDILRRPFHKGLAIVHRILKIPLNDGLILFVKILLDVPY